jgi:cell pole-organizing protein PopZ
MKYLTGLLKSTAVGLLLIASTAGAQPAKHDAATPQAEQPTSPAVPGPMFDPRTVNEQLLATQGVLALREKEKQAMAADMLAAAKKAADDLKAVDTYWRAYINGLCASNQACQIPATSDKNEAGDKSK